MNWRSKAGRAPLPMNAVTTNATAMLAAAHAATATTQLLDLYQGASGSGLHKTCGFFATSDMFTKT